MSQSLYELVKSELGRQSILGSQLPSSISDNLNPAFPMRPYQMEAFKFFTNYWEKPFDGKPSQNHQVLFHMATGSGKTLMMAGLILYLYEMGYRRFLFFVNSTNIIEKTRDNFLNRLSPKYLFAPIIAVKEKPIEIREVSTFQTATSDDVNIIFATIQGLHSRLNNPGEDQVTYDDFENQRIVLISDEAHHINADTKKGKNLAQLELLEESESWEGTVDRIFRANPANVLLEFTATVDFTDLNLEAKYKPKLLFDYGLKQFRKDGYSKEVKVLEADLEPVDRALQAVLMSQHRKKLFEKHGKSIKPVLLFKSRTIAESRSFVNDFISAVKSLSESKLTQLKSGAKDAAVKRVFEYCETHNIGLDALAMELQEDFSLEKLLSVNSKEESEEKQIAVNSLETNEYRAVFAVDKLNEGWDVLNLFDIVRLYNTRDSKAGTVGKTTMSEAQLIGRGARYCPFQVLNEQPLFKRKYDADNANELRLCEELYYHSVYNPKYIQELNAALREIGIKPSESVQRKILLKESFKQTTFYESGHVYLNDRYEYRGEDADGLDVAIRDGRYSFSLRTGAVATLLAFDAEPTPGKETKRLDYAMSDFGIQVLRKALHRLKFFEFANLKRLFPTLETLDQFATHDKYLGSIKVEIDGLPNQHVSLSAEHKLQAAMSALTEIAARVEKGKVDYKGSTTFKPRMVKEVFTDRIVNIALDDGGDKEFGRSIKEAGSTSYYLDLDSKSWFAFEDNFGTSEEKLLIRYIDKRYDELKQKYSGVYLVRNEKHFQLFAFDDGRALEPDFVLFLIGKSGNPTMYFQVFIEPKGKHLLMADEWKERFLTRIKEQAEVVQMFSNRKYVVWGLPFYNSEERTKAFQEAFDDLLKESATAT